MNLLTPTIQILSDIATGNTTKVTVKEGENHLQNPNVQRALSEGHLCVELVDKNGKLCGITGVLPPGT